MVIRGAVTKGAGGRIQDPAKTWVVATALDALDGELAIATGFQTAVSVVILPFTPPIRLAAISPSPDILAAALTITVAGSDVAAGRRSPALRAHHAAVIESLQSPARWKVRDAAAGVR